VPEIRDDKGHGDETVDGSLVVEVCGSNLAQGSKSCEQESLPNETGDLKTVFTSKEYDQGYFSLPRRSESFVVNSPKYPPFQLPTPTLSSESMLYYRNSTEALTDKSVLSQTLPNERSTISVQSVECQTDLMLFATTGDEFNTLILLQPTRQQNEAMMIKYSASKENLISGFFLTVVPNVLILAALWNHSQGHIIDLEEVIRRYVFPTFKKWFR